MSKKKAFSSLKNQYNRAEEEEDRSRPYGGLPSDLLQELQASQSMALSLSSKEIRVGAFVWKPTGMVLDGEAKVEDWQETGRILRKLDESIQWLLGDWIVMGEAYNYGERLAFAESIGFNVKTLDDYAYVARKVNFSVRTENLSFGHHKLVASLSDTDEQERWLKNASENHWSIAKLRDEMNGEKASQYIENSINDIFFDEYKRQRQKAFDLIRKGASRKQVAQMYRKLADDIEKDS
jgi:hypothetical protein